MPLRGDGGRDLLLSHAYCNADEDFRFLCVHPDVPAANGKNSSLPNRQNAVRRARIAKYIFKVFTQICCEIEGIIKRLYNPYVVFVGEHLYGRFTPEFMETSVI